VGDLLDVIAATGYRVADSVDGVAALRAQTQLMLAGFLRLADRLAGAPTVLLSGARVSDQALRDDALSWLRRWRDDPASRRSALAAVIAGEWLQQLGELTADLEAPVDAAVVAGRVPWWR
jgi:hypothetical protein